MDLIKALRRSMKGDKHKQSPSIGSKSAVAIVPPKKVIRANDDYHPDDALVQSFASAGVQVLSFSKGDFFHVIGREEDPDWYEACNPALPDARGLVPVSYFQVLGRTERDSAQSDGGRQPTAKIPDHDSGYGETPIQPSPAAPQRGSKSAETGGIVHATVRYSFSADKGRPDELSAEKYEPLIIIAQSNSEWVVAKPIRRLGGPGLIPIGFIYIYDKASYRTDPPTPVEDALEALKRAGVPTVEEWKRMAAQYKNSSITLGKFDGSKGPTRQQPGIEQSLERMSLQQQAARQSQQNGTQQQQGGSVSASQLCAPVWARIPRYCFAEDKYWFVIEAELEDGRCWELSRYYQDFYDFQIALLAEFPAEAGNTGTQKRSLPYMPGPVSYVTDAITEGRLYNLDAYVKNLLNQPVQISRCDLVKLFFAPREGDYEIDANANGEDEYRLSQGSHQSSVDSPANAASRQSSRNNLNGYGYSGLSATPRQGSSSNLGGAQSQQQSQASLAMKIKVKFKEDVFAMRVATDIQFQELHDKIRDRVKAAPDEQMQLFYLDDPSGSQQNLMSDSDLDYALQRNEKLTVYVEVI
ncbi:Polarity protein BemA [Tolypocladium paradoxum]|uniref:Polarity protein BemA n=1 Tax=Tolypocladium paradoxum TaxID=94208 RepID=A0A2S4L094_9HYPO|nr:Polarity protein BemA [Tolypocladium paradoxum]